MSLLVTALPPRAYFAQTHACMHMHSNAEIFLVIFQVKLCYDYCLDFLSPLIPN